MNNELLVGALQDMHPTVTLASLREVVKSAEHHAESILYTLPYETKICVKILRALYILEPANRKHYREAERTLLLPYSRIEERAE